MKRIGFFFFLLLPPAFCVTCSLHTFLHPMLSPSSSPLSSSSCFPRTLAGIAWSLLSLDCEHGPVQAIVLEPLVGSSDSASRPLLLCPHGGPHSVFSADFFPLYAGFAALGYVVAMVNYRGSLCFGQVSERDGRCGAVHGMFINKTIYLGLGLDRQPLGQDWCTRCRGLQQYHQQASRAWQGLPQQGMASREKTCHNLRLDVPSTDSITPRSPRPFIRVPCLAVHTAGF